VLSEPQKCHNVIEAAIVLFIKNSHTTGVIRSHRTNTSKSYSTLFIILCLQVCVTADILAYVDLRVNSMLRCLALPMPLEQSTCRTTWLTLLNLLFAGHL